MSAFGWLLPVLAAWAWAAAASADENPLSGDTSWPVAYADGAPLFKSRPIVLEVAQVGTDFESATISDIAVADFDLDGRNELAVAWFATDLHDASKGIRRVTIYRVLPGGPAGLRFEVMADLDLFMFDPVVPALSIFRNGTAALAVGDFDGDGDPDLAVHAFFGDELWLIENRGGGEFQKHIKFPFYFNSTGNFITPPESLAGDFDGDGRDELVYIADPILQIDARIIHFWRTESTIANMYRVDWEGLEDPVFTQWTRGLAVTDFDGDGRADLCFSGTMNPPYESGPILTFWYGLDTATRRFHVQHYYPSILCSDVLDVRPNPDCGPGVILTDLNGATMQYWVGTCGDDLGFSLAVEVTGYSGLSPNRGMTAVAAELNGDGDVDLVTKQKCGHSYDPAQVQITEYNQVTGGWILADPDPLDSSGFENYIYTQILRPRNLAIGDFMGNTLPEIVAAFGPSLPSSNPGLPYNVLQVAIWPNCCAGDINADGLVDGRDLRLLYDSLGHCRGELEFNPNADLDRDGCVADADMSLFVADVGCVAAEWVPNPCPGQPIGDSNCDGAVNVFDLEPFSVAVCEGRAAWAALIAPARCDFLCVNDLDGNGVVDAFDIDLFVRCVERD